MFVIVCESIMCFLNSCRISVSLNLCLFCCFHYQFWIFLFSSGLMDYRAKMELQLWGMWTNFNTLSTGTGILYSTYCWSNKINIKQMISMKLYFENKLIFSNMLNTIVFWIWRNFWMKFQAPGTPCRMYGGHGILLL